jgi:hypothetical protein
LLRGCDRSDWKIDRKKENPSNHYGKHLSTPILLGLGWIYEKSRKYP